MSNRSTASFFGRTNRDNQTSRDKESQMQGSWRRRPRADTTDNQADQENQAPATISSSNNQQPTRGSISSTRTPLAELSNEAPTRPGRGRFPGIGVVHGNGRRISVADSVLAHLRPVSPQCPASSSSAQPQPPTKPEPQPEPQPEPKPLIDDDGFQEVRNSRSARSRATRLTHTQQSDFPNPPQQQAPVPPSTTRNTTTARGRNSNTRPIHRTRDHAVSWEEQVAGIIVRRLDMHRAHNAKLGAPGIFEGPDGRPWIKKPRYSIILKRFGETIAEIPIYTYEDKGRSKKPDDLVWEYLSLRPLGVAPSEFTNQSPSNPVLSVGKVTTGYGSQLTRRTMVVHFTEITTRWSADCPELAKVGELDAASTKVVLEYAYEKAPKGLW